MTIRDFIETNQIARQINDNGAFNLEVDLSAFYDEHEEEIREEFSQISQGDVLGFLFQNVQWHPISDVDDLKCIVASSVLENMAEMMVYEMDNPDCEKEANE